MPEEKVTIEQVAELLGVKLMPPLDASDVHPCPDIRPWWTTQTASFRNMRRPFALILQSQPPRPKKEKESGGGE